MGKKLVSPFPEITDGFSAFAPKILSPTTGYVYGTHVIAALTALRERIEARTLTPQDLQDYRYSLSGSSQGTFISAWAAFVTYLREKPWPLLNPPVTLPAGRSGPKPKTEIERPPKVDAALVALYEWHLLRPPEFLALPAGTIYELRSSPRAPWRVHEAAKIWWEWAHPASLTLSPDGVPAFPIAPDSTKTLARSTLSQIIGKVTGGLDARDLIRLPKFARMGQTVFPRCGYFFDTAYGFLRVEGIEVVYMIIGSTANLHALLEGDEYGIGHRLKIMGQLTPGMAPVTGAEWKEPFVSMETIQAMDHAQNTHTRFLAGRDPDGMPAFATTATKKQIEQDLGIDLWPDLLDADLNTPAPVPAPVAPAEETPIVVRVGEHAESTPEDPPLV